MPKWRNKDIIVYHGTDDVSAGAQGRAVNDLITFSISLALCRPFTDFGQGFYVTTSEHQAKQWANARILRSLAPTGPTPNAIVLAFNLGRDWLAQLDTLTFVRPITDFWDLVEDCRTQFPPHQRRVQGKPSYDAVYGPVTLWPQRLVIQDCDQISFHTHHAVRSLGTPWIHAQAPGLF